MAKKLQFTLGVEVICLSPFMGLPSGPGVAELFSDGSYKVKIHDGNIYQGAEKIAWSYGLIKGVDEEHLYLNVAPMVSAKISETAEYGELEVWLNKHHKK